MATPPEEETCEVLCVHQAAVDEVRAHTPSPQQFADMAGLFKLFGDATGSRFCGVSASTSSVSAIWPI